MQQSTSPSLHVGSIPKNFKTFIFKPKLSFLEENHQNDYKGEFPDDDFREKKN